MATRALITYYNQETKKYQTIYQHWDGYPEGLGKTLVNHYQDENKIKEMISLGHASSINEKLEPVPAHLVDKKTADLTEAERAEKYSYSTFYMRDMGETYQNAFETATFCRAQQINMGTEFHYLWKDGKWEAFTRAGHKVHI